MIATDIVAMVYGLGSAITWGAADFSGGYASRKSKVLSVILISQIIGLLSLTVLEFLFAEKMPVPEHLAWGGLAGFCGALGLVALYKGLSSGRMGIVAPVSAIVTALIPLIVSAFIEGWPGNTQMIGFVCALATVWLFSSGQSQGRIFKTEIGLSLMAGMGFSLFFICIDHVSNEAILWPLLAARVVSISFIAVVLVARRQPPLVPRKDLPYIVLTGVLDIAGNAFFALASQIGRLDASAILSSLYPASTVLLARCFLKEPISLKQGMGLLTACLALALIAV